jgi:hypothetical protein
VNKQKNKTHTDRKTHCTKIITHYVCRKKYKMIRRTLLFIISILKKSNGVKKVFEDKQATGTNKK